MLDRATNHQGALELREPRRALRPFSGTEFTEEDVDRFAEFPQTPWTANHPGTRASRTSLAQPSEVHAVGTYTATILHFPEAWVEVGRLPLTSFTSTAAFSFKSLTEPLTAYRHETPFRVVLRGQNCFVIKADEATAFTERDYLEGEGESIEAMILAAPSSLPVPYAGHLSRRLIDLLTASREEAEAEPEMSRSSLKWFLYFIRSNSQLACPLVGLSPEGNIYATWRRSRDALFSAHFLPSGLVRFVVFTPNPRQRNAVTRLSGATTASNLLDTVRPHGVLSWACREG